MKSTLLLFTSIFILYTADSHAQQTCEVQLEDIKGTYTGDCNDGKANGEGKSIGTDTYEGTFKNGLPNGMGKYTWKNGDYYFGEWKKGMKEGKGEIHKTTDEKEAVTKGYWKKDVYKGQSLKPYIIHDATSEIGRVEVTKIRDGGNVISIDVHSMTGGQNNTTSSSDGTHEGSEVRGTTSNISLTEIRVQAGSYDSKTTNMLSNKEVTNIKNVVFPFRATFVFGSNSTVDIEIFDEGNWSISVPVQK